MKRLFCAAAGVLLLTVVSCAQSTSLPSTLTQSAVTVSGISYSESSLSKLWTCAQNSTLSQQTVLWAKEHRQEVVEALVSQAATQGLDAAGLRAVLADLNVGVNLPVAVEKALYAGQEAWIVVACWEMDSNPELKLSHVFSAAYGYGTNQLLKKVSCK